jgi:hypothetical protein
MAKLKFWVKENHCRVDNPLDDEEIAKHTKEHETLYIISFLIVTSCFVNGHEFSVQLDIKPHKIRLHYNN